MARRSEDHRINRRELVARHNIIQDHLDPQSPVSVGNGELAFTVDLTGLQSFPDSYPVAVYEKMHDAGTPGTLLGTQSQWGWHSTPPPEPYDLSGSTILFESARGRVPYVDQLSADPLYTGPAAAAEQWLRANPHRLDLGRIGFALETAGATTPLDPADVSAPTQTLDLWTGVLTSTFTALGHRVTVHTACHPERDQLGIEVTSEALRHGLVVTAAFPYGSQEWHNAAEWHSPGAHLTRLEHVGSTAEASAWLIHRHLDETRYTVLVDGSGLHVHQQSDHQVTIRWAATGPRTTVPRMDLSIAFEPVANGACTPSLHGTEAWPDPADDRSRAAHHPVMLASARHWPRFWASGGALDLHHTKTPDGTVDPQAAELERRVVLSQYLTAVNCAGSLPPQETGLVCNSWRGRFHLEMHWWHAAHFAHWGRPELLLPSLRWYRTALESSQERARSQGFDGARWPKQVAPDGRESPSPIGTFLIWQQPHPIHLAELAYRAAPTPELLAEFADVVFESADFMASLAVRTERGFALGAPLIPAQESYAHTRRANSNPTFELAYWQWGLRTAAAWRERLGLPVPPLWTEVADSMVSPSILDGAYQGIDGEPFTIRTDHPAMLCALGLVPKTDLIDPAVMATTLDAVLADWDWDSTWGWDYPVLAMTAARLGQPGKAVSALLLNAEKNTFLANGHNRQTPALPLYLPGNGGLLSAVALMAAGWDGGPETHAPGFPDYWTVDWEGLVPAP